MTRKDIFISAGGVTERGHSKSAFGIFFDNWDMTDKTKVKDADSVMADEPVVNISENLKYTQISFTYKSPNEMRHHYNLLMDYKRASDNTDYENDTVYPLITISVMPHEFHGQYCIIAYCPAFFTLTPDIDGSINTITFVFDSENVEVFYNEVE